MARRLDELLEASAAGHPDRLAVEDPAAGTSISYRDLDAGAEVLAAKLREAGVAAGDRVGVCAPKSIGSVLAVFAAMKAGAAYVPAPYDAPAERNAFIFRDCAVAALVVDANVWQGLAGPLGDLSRGEPIALGEGSEHLDGLVLVALRGGPCDAGIPAELRRALSYILYTSGSTGRPKGVIHTHASALSFVDWCSTVLDPTPQDRFSSHAPFHFDLSIHDLYVPIKHGATLVLINESLGKQPAGLAETIASHGITVWYSTPSILRMLVDFGQLDRWDCAALRVIIFAGEVFSTKHLRRLKEILPGARYLNFYGPTETNVCTWHEVEAVIPAGRTEPYPIGKVCAGDSARVVDADGREAPTGEEGELLISGPTVMVGYWNLPERNAEAFVTAPDGTRWHRTGDVARVDENGDFVYLGRRDRMVKRRGYRVELGEIEAALYRHAHIGEAAAVATADEESGVRITAFVAWSGGGKPSLIAMKQYCMEQLPPYMVPDAFSFHDVLPKTSTDKVDYQRLKELA